MRYETLTIPYISYLKLIVKAKNLNEFSRESLLVKMTGRTTVPLSKHFPGSNMTTLSLAHYICKLGRCY